MVLSVRSRCTSHGRPRSPLALPSRQVCARSRRSMQMFVRRFLGWRFVGHANHAMAAERRHEVVTERRLRHGATRRASTPRSRGGHSALHGVS